MSESSIEWPKVLDKLLEGEDLSSHLAAGLMQAWLSEELQPVQTGAFLAALRSKGVIGSELSAMAEVLRESCSLPCPLPDLFLVDTCGTGGDGANTFNISTAVAFTSASCGVNIAKHGNRSASGKVGSADVLEGMGLNLKAPLKKTVEALQETNITFLFAPAWHPSLVGLAPLRKAIGIRTVFNLLGPLVNPLRPSAQVLGVAKSELLEPISSALQGLNLHRAVVVHGAGGLDEASLQGPNEIRLLNNGVITSSLLDPATFGLKKASVDALKGGDLDENKQIITSVLQGRGLREHTEVVALNTSLVLWAAGIEDDFSKGVSLALNSLGEGLPWKKYLDLQKVLN
tara:strand:+ start:564 stop:1595 length:1032 start_codon:yes stop_codon:yes gene_type:complete